VSNWLTNTTELLTVSMNCGRLTKSWRKPLDTEDKGGKMCLSQRI
jgi:hypothetical protein